MKEESRQLEQCARLQDSHPDQPVSIPGYAQLLSMTCNNSALHDLTRRISIATNAFHHIGPCMLRQSLSLNAQIVS